MIEPAINLDPVKSSRLGSISHAWRALRHRNFRLFVFGQGISLVGTWMTQLATGWLVYRLTNSALLLGVVGFAGQIASFALAPMAGVIVERLNRHKLLIFTQAAFAAQTLVMAVLALTHVINLTEIIILTALQGVIGAVDMPARQSFFIQIVEDRNDLSNAIAINSSLVNGARLVGPALAGTVIALVGEGWCFAIDGLSYFVVIGSLLLMHIDLRGVVVDRSDILAQLQQGWTYVSTFHPVRDILLIVALISLFGAPYAVLMPIFVGHVLTGGPNTLGWLMGASGTGAFVSALSLTFRKTVFGLGRMIQIATAILGAALILCGLLHSLKSSILLLVFVGFGLMQTAAAANTILQYIVPDDRRARTLSYFTMAFLGIAPFGSLMAGTLAHQFGVPHTLIFMGISCVLSSLWLTRALPQINGCLRQTKEI